MVGDTAAKVKGGTLAVEQVYLLDATQLKRGADGVAAGGPVFLLAEQVDFRGGLSDPGAGSGTYGFAIVDVTDTQFAVAAVVSAAAGSGAVDDGGLLSEADDGGGS